MPTSTEIRKQFVEFFVTKHGHTNVPSSPVVPHDDQTLLFANAGMNQFKPYFLGTAQPPWKRVANTQKCIRAGGKHNDLDDVGKDTYHHTFFEMLGNWSFGDYFKRDAIAWAWELLTEVWGLDTSRLHVTVFGGDKAEGLERDDEAAKLWKDVAGVDPKHLHSGSKKDNFWEMGATGPCGPCTEIHIDRTPDKTGGKLVNAGVPEVMEIWNLVFIQYNRGEDGKLTPLPAKHVDTGMGFERVTAVLQGKDSNYDTDVFAPVFEAIRTVTKAAPYTGKLDDLKDIAYRVIADHIRMLTFALTDGAMPSNEGRGYVVRSVLRRAERYGRQYLGTKQPFLHELVPTVVTAMGEAFPELTGRSKAVCDTIHDEEESFLRTLDRGIRLFQDVSKRTKKAGQTVIGGKDIFELHTTYGIFPDITAQMANEEGLTLDMPGYDAEMRKHVEVSGKDRKTFVVTAITGELPKTDDTPKYENRFSREQIVGWVIDNTVSREGSLKAGDQAALLLDRTCFYAEQGGQVGDSGTITTDTGTFTVADTQRLGDSVLHIGKVTAGTVTVGQTASLAVDENRIDTMRNHTATHLLNLALRQVLGPEVDQRGSLVDADKTRFDFTWNAALTPEQIARVEQIVNEQIYLNLPVTVQTLPLADARQIPGVRAVFGEKYPDPVRVVMIGPANAKTARADQSVEFCGGTHLSRSGGAGFFKIVSQEAVAKGVRRVTGVTGKQAVAAVQNQSAILDALTARFNCRPEELSLRVESLQEEVKKLQTQLKKGASADLATAADALLASATEVGGAKLVVGELPAGPVDALRAQVDRLRQRVGTGVILVGWVEDGKVSLLAAVTEDLLTKGLHAGKLVEMAAARVEGKGGGKPTGIAQGGGKNPAQLAAALAAVKQTARAALQS